jgi:glycerate 2-kinase
LIIKNYESLATTETRRLALSLIEAGIKSVLPTNLMKSSIKYDDSTRTLVVRGDAYHLNSGRIFVVGGGKASGLMAETLEKIIPHEVITAGVVNTKSGYYKTRRIKINLAGHPLPDQRGVAGVKMMLSLKYQYVINENDLIICLLSGGGSSLMPMPVAGISLKDKQETTNLLLRAGADINEINTVRKHLSQVKGGKLGQFFSPARVVSIIISDVIGNDLSVIASGPTCDDFSAFDDAYKVISRHQLKNKIPPNVFSYIQKGRKAQIPNTLIDSNNCHNYIIGDNSIALRAMVRKAKRMGLNPNIITTEMHGETTAVSMTIAKNILNSKYKGSDVILLGGETTPKLPPDAGKGGRNQHYAAVSLLAMRKCIGEWAVASIGTDGSDYLPDVAGAIVDKHSLWIADDKNVNIRDYIDRYDSYNLFENIGNSLVITGDTGTNVGDIIVYILR